MAPRSSATMVTSSFLFFAMLMQLVSAAATNTIMNSTDDISIGPAILAIIAIVVGAAVCVAGYRFFPYAIFVCGFILGGLAVASLIEAIGANKDWVNTASWIGFFVGGLIIGILAFMLYGISIFIAGAAAGVLLAFTLHTSVLYRISDSHPNTVLVIVAVLFGIIGGILAWKLERPVIIIATAFVGAVAVAWGVGYFAGDYPNGADLEYFRKNDSISIPGAWWAYLAGIVVLFVLGAMIQFRKTGRGNDHHHKHSRAHHAIPGYSAHV